MRYTYLALAFLVACSSEPSIKTVPVEDMDVFSIRATGNISTPAIMTDVAYVPNNVASWMSQIILLSEDGDIWQTTSDGDTPRRVSKGDYQDIRGLRRDNEPGIFLAAQPDGRVSAFIEREDIGNYKPMTISQGSFGVKQFCDGSDNRIWVLDMENNLRRLALETSADMALELASNAPITPPNTALSCTTGADEAVHVVMQKNETVRTRVYKDGDWELDQAELNSPTLTLLPLETTDLRLGLDALTSTPLIVHNGVSKRLLIDDGLSIRGLSKASFVHGTDHAMGSAYNEGLILFGDAENGRVVLLSLDFMNYVLTQTGIEIEL